MFAEHTKCLTGLKYSLCKIGFSGSKTSPTSVICPSLVATANHCNLQKIFGASKMTKLMRNFFMRN